jgi:RNA polymerase subunit RPABC4/transcription elongation factor Spt4
MVFALSAFLPLLTWLVNLSLFDFYALETGTWKSLQGIEWRGLPSNMYGIYITMVLYPIVLTLGLLAVAARFSLVALIAGLCGFLCWISAFVVVEQVREMSTLLSGFVSFGSGIFVGFFGAALLLGTHFLGRVEFSKEISIQQSIAPTHSEGKYCTACGAMLQENDVFCRICGVHIASVRVHAQGTMICSRCKNHIPSDSRFCPKCGADLFPELTKT